MCFALHDMKMAENILQVTIQILSVDKFQWSRHESSSEQMKFSVTSRLNSCDRAALHIIKQLIKP